MSTAHQPQPSPVPISDEGSIAVLSLPSSKARWVLLAIIVCIALLALRSTEPASEVSFIRIMFLGLAALAGMSSNWSA